MIFFPSYQYMEQVEYAVEDVDFPADLLVQGQGMKEQERQEFLEEFEKPRDHSLAAFCVMGGVFSEGIDLKEERLIGAVIVGTGLPMVCVEQEVLRGYFEEKEEAGFDFAYQYPGMNKVLQAAGRVIRTTEDEGIILLLDDRFLKKEYLELFPQGELGAIFQMVNRKTSVSAFRTSGSHGAGRWISGQSFAGTVQGICRSGEGLLQVLQHIHELLRGLGDRKVFVMDHNKLADRKCLGEL